MEASLYSLISGGSLQPALRFDAYRRLRYLQEHRPILYANLKTSGKIRSHLADVEEQANALFLRLVKDYAASEGVTEQLKAEVPMEWVRRMNGIRARAMEVVRQELIDT